MFGAGLSLKRLAGDYYTKSRTCLEVWSVGCSWIVRQIHWSHIKTSWIFVHSFHVHGQFDGMMRILFSGFHSILDNGILLPVALSFFFTSAKAQLGCGYYNYNRYSYPCSAGLGYCKCDLPYFLWNSPVSKINPRTYFRGNTVCWLKYLLSSIIIWKLHALRLALWIWSNGANKPLFIQQRYVSNERLQLRLWSPEHGLRTFALFGSLW